MTESMPRRATLCQVDNLQKKSSSVYRRILQQRILIAAELQRIREKRERYLNGKLVSTNPKA